jgi:low affinity Fe/Cu permease
VSSESLADAFRHTLTNLGVWTARPAAFLVVFVYAVLWWAFDPDTFNWHAAATIATWLMTLVIQRAEHRDTQAVHAKLDELLKADKAARTELSHIDEDDAEEIEAKRHKDPLVD